MTAILVSSYLIFLVVFLIASFFGLYQLWQFGYVGDASRRIVMLYTIASVVIILLTFFIFFVSR